MTAEAGGSGSTVHIVKKQIAMNTDAQLLSAEAPANGKVSSIFRVAHPTSIK